MSRILKIWLVNLVLTLLIPVQTLHAPTVMPDSNLPEHELTVDIRQTVLSNATRELSEEIDRRFIERAGQVLSTIEQRSNSAPARIEVYRGVWSIQSSYVRGDLVVADDGSTWVCNRTNAGIRPNSWQDVDIWSFIPRYADRDTICGSHLHDEQPPNLYEQPKCSNPACRRRNCTDRACRVFTLAIRDIERGEANHSA